MLSDVAARIFFSISHETNILITKLIEKSNENY